MVMPGASNITYIISEEYEYVKLATMTYHALCNCSQILLSDSIDIKYFSKGNVS